ncbi:TPA: endonuclease [Pseudomonas aeruginosa]|nr:endonuclease [Pseudomonas aeruginosa]
MQQLKSHGWKWQVSGGLIHGLVERLKRPLLTAVALAVAVAVVPAGAAPDNFSDAKRLLRQHVYQDQNLSQAGDFYCGCKWQWVGKSGGRMDLGSCGFQTNKHVDRAARLEWEHVFAASSFGRQRQCWRNGGRQNCQRTDPEFNRMEADLFNLVPAVGAANALRSDINYGMVSGPVEPLGACTTKVATTLRVVEPRNEVKGEAARITFYMADRYNIRLSEKQQQVLMAWDRTYPVSAWERERDRRISYAMGHHNPFVTGERKWVPGYKPQGSGQAATSRAVPARQPEVPARQVQVAARQDGPVFGNKRSGVYHLPQGCPSYSQVSTKNRVQFSTEQEALAAGFRKAGNCS